MRILVTGCAGQDGILLSRLLVREGHEVIGAVRQASVEYLEVASPGVVPFGINLLDELEVINMLEVTNPEWVINLAGFSSVARSWKNPEENSLINFGLVKMISNWVIKNNLKCKILQASSSEIFGASKDSPQTENTPSNPASPYGEAKVLAQEHLMRLSKNYNLDVRTAILYNHESPLRRAEFVSRHISSQVARLSLGLKDHITIGDVNAKRDWGWAPDYVDAMRNMLFAPSNETYLLASGRTHTVQEFLQNSFEAIGLTADEKFIKIADSSFRAIDPKYLVGDPTKAIKSGILNHTHDLKQIAYKMVHWDIKSLREDLSKMPWSSDGNG
jgi:GDPmannose 4,6-dehydratase